MPTKGKKPEAKQKKVKNSDAPEVHIHASMRVSEILTLLPDSAPVLGNYGLSCFHCSANSIETLEQGARSHGFSDEDLTDLVTDLNEMLKNRPERPQVLMLAESAARKLQEILAAEGKKGWGLLVALDEGGGFAMELIAKPDSSFHTFRCDGVSDVALFASTQTLSSIGGATIDFRDGRFKLDLPEDMAKIGGCACENGGECGCA